MTAPEQICPIALARLKLAWDLLFRGRILLDQMTEVAERVVCFAVLRATFLIAVCLGLVIENVVTIGLRPVLIIEVDFVLRCVERLP